MASEREGDIRTAGSNGDEGTIEDRGSGGKKNDGIEKKSSREK